MEKLFQLWDRAEDFVVAAALRLQRAFSRRPRERRRVARPSGTESVPPGLKRRRTDSRAA